MDVLPFLVSSVNAIGTMIIVVMFVTGPLALAVDFAWRATSRG